MNSGLLKVGNASKCCIADFCNLTASALMLNSGRTWYNTELISIERLTLLLQAFLQ